MSKWERANLWLSVLYVVTGLHSNAFIRWWMAILAGLYVLKAVLSEPSGQVVQAIPKTEE